MYNFIHGKVSSMAVLLEVRFTNCLLSVRDGITIYNFLFIYDSAQIKSYECIIIKMIFFVANNKNRLVFDTPLFLIVTHSYFYITK